MVVKIDESVFFKRKYNRGQRREHSWIFGAVERETGATVVFTVPNRSAKQLLPLLNRWILPGSIIVSDMWKAYNGIASMGNFYTHFNLSTTRLSTLV